MAEQIIRFNDGEAYERAMGLWSQPVGTVFLDWLALPKGLRWIDVGCGNGAFTEVLVQRSAPAEVHGLDPSEGQLRFARARPTTPGAVFVPGDAMALPFDDDRFEAAAMALVIFFVPDPAKAVAEMARVVVPGGTVAAYAWDVLGGGSPSDLVQGEMRALGVTPPLPPSASASRLAALQELWRKAGLEAIDTREITVRRTFLDFEDFWGASKAMASLAPALDAMTDDAVAELKARVRARLPADAAGQVAWQARANAVRGRVPI